MNKRQVKVTINGKPYEVEVEDLAATPVKVTVNGKSYVVDSIETSGESLVASPTVAIPAPATAAPRVAAARPATPQAAAGNAMVAPMPGIIDDIAVKVGDAVTLGQQLCTLEAMKMKSAIRSTRAGVIASIAVENKRKVAYGETLFTYE
jgi:biotin carboxyl carrier protein